MACHTAHRPGRARLRAVAACIPPGSRVADVGSDHGLLPKMLIEAGRARSCVATERSRGGPLGALAGYDGRIAVRFGDGLDALSADDPVDVVVMAGMGTRTIVRILERGRDRLVDVSRLVLQAQSEWPQLRRWLGGHGFRLVDERMVEERGRFYLILVAEPGTSSPDAVPGLSADDLLEAGLISVRAGAAETLAYWRDRIQRIERARQGLRPERRQRLDDLLERALRIHAVLAGRAICAAPDGLPE